MKARWCDPVLQVPLAALLIVLWSCLYSATQFGQAGEAAKQAVHLAIGTVLMLIVSRVDYRLWRRLAWPVYGLTMLALLAVMFVGTSVNGAKRWVTLGSLGTFQPSELAKFATIIVLAKLFAAGFSWKRLGTAAVVVAGPFLLILLQPDLGTALVIAFVCASMAYAAGLNGTFLFAAIGLGVSALPGILKEYQRDRLLVFINPEIDPDGMGYQLVQSQTAIGSGRLWGKGLLAGPMTQHGFVPENWTDFLFTVIGEELGFAGSCTVLVLYGLIFLILLRSASQARDRLGSLLVLGVASLLIFHVAVNISMTIGLAPVVGIPLPFGSYGGTALCVNFAALGIVSSVRRDSLPEEIVLSDAANPE